MGVNIVYQNENEKELEKVIDHNIIGKIIPDFNDSSSYCLRYIDLYGDTTFNRLQIDQLKKEFESKLNETQDDKIKSFIKRILVLIDKCKKNIHTYIKFVGD